MPYEIARERMTYGYIWSDWLYGTDKDSRMVEIYNECKGIDECADLGEKAKRLKLLGDKIQNSRKSWVEGIIDFIDFETTSLRNGNPPVQELGSSEPGMKVLAVIHSAYLHGAFRGLCRTASGEEWIGTFGEWCSAAIHQGLKGMRPDGAQEWELPTMGEKWCKGVSLWALCSLYVAVDIAGEDPDNDAILARIHTVIGAHHLAGICWAAYRGPHPHQWFSPSIRGAAPAPVDIRRFGAKYNYPKEMIEVLCRAADHVNTWSNPPYAAVHLDRTRDLLIGDHTPRLKRRIDEVCESMSELLDDITSAEAREIRSRAYKWMAGFTSRWRGRGDTNDSVMELHLPGAALGVLRESRKSIYPIFADRWAEWASERSRVALDDDQMNELLDLIRKTAEVRGRFYGTSGGYSGSMGTGDARWIDGVWKLATLTTILGSPDPEHNIDGDLRESIIRLFNAVTGSKRIEGVDKPPGAAGEGCMVCIGDHIFRGLVNTRCTPPIIQIVFWGTFLYMNLGLGPVDDNALGTIAS